MTTETNHPALNLRMLITWRTTSCCYKPKNLANNEFEVSTRDGSIKEMIPAGNFENRIKK